MLEARWLVVSRLLAPFDRSLLSPRPTSKVWRIDIQSQGQLIKTGLLSILTLHPAEKFHGFRDSERLTSRLRPSRAVLSRTGSPHQEQVGGSLKTNRSLFLISIHGIARLESGKRPLSYADKIMY